MLSTGKPRAMTYLTQLRVLDNSPIATKLLHRMMARCNISKPFDQYMKKATSHGYIQGTCKRHYNQSNESPNVF
jgi:hypothetical protein